MAKLKTLVRESLINYPTLFGQSRWKALNQILVVNGNGMYWNHKGEIQSYGSPSKEKYTPTKKEVHKKIFQLLATVPTVSQTRSRFVFDHNLYWVFDDQHTQDQDLWEKFAESAPFRELPYNYSGYLKTIASPITFYTLDLNRYSLLAHPPANVTTEYVAAIQEVLLKILSLPQSEPHTQQNHVHALILLHKFQPLFRKHGIPLTTNKYIHIREETGKRALELDCKRHVGNHNLDESLLNNQEFFELYHLDPTGFTSHELNLLRNYVQFLTWKEEHQALTREKHQKEMFQVKRKFWKAAKITKNKLVVNIPKECITWVRMQTL